MLSQPAPIPSTGQIHPFPPSSHPSPHLTVKFTPSRPAVILHLCWRQIHSSPPSGHPPPLLAVKFTPPRPAVILSPIWQSNAALPTQRSSSPPSCGQIHPSPPSGHPPPLLAVNFTPSPCYWVFQGERDKEGGG